MLVLLILNIILSAILIAIAIVFHNEVVYWYKSHKIRSTQKEKVVRACSIESFKQNLMCSSSKMVALKNKIEYPTLTGDTFIKRFVYSWKHQDPVESFSWQYSECGWLLYALAEAGYDLMRIKEIFEHHVLKEKITIVDQAQCGMVALLLYQKTREKKYKDYADSLYHFLISRVNDYGLPYRDGANQDILVDTIGMAIPFLIEYSQMFPVSDAFAYDIVEKFVKYGTDYETGLPAFGFYTIKPYIKRGACNWGRGSAWYVIGLSYIDKARLSDTAISQIEKLEKTLVYLYNKNHSFGHFLGKKDRDLSAELPILFYLSKKKLIKLTEKDILDYSLMCHNGIVYNSSSSNTGIIAYGTLCGPNVLSQAYMIRIITLYENLLNNEQ